MKNPQRRQLFQYDGCRFIGRIVLAGGKAKAFNGAGKRLGTFPGIRAAMAAISAAHMSALLSAADLPRIDEMRTPGRAVPVNQEGVV